MLNALLRYLLILLPAIGAVYILPLSIGGLLTFHVLLLLAWAELRRAWVPAGLQLFAALLEMLYVTWLAHSYGSLMLLCHLSTLSTYMRYSEGSPRWFLLALQFVLLQYTFWLRPLPELQWGGSLLFLSAAALLHNVSNAEKHKLEQTVLYDELRRKANELDAAKNRVLEYAGKVEHLAQVEERNRISREIHDDLGHRLIRLKMMLEAAVKVGPTDPDKGLELTHQVLSQLSEGMEKLRFTVRKLKPEEREVHSYSLSKLIEGLAAEAQISVHYEVKGNPMQLYPSLEIVLYRNAQEAITNALRHGRATLVDIQLSYEPSAVRLTVTNNGIVPDPVRIHKGLGLSGMEERAKLLGGELHWDCGSRFGITTVLPLRS
ncbi:sensor histidine kinase [Paenibacillus silviterrae]|uniref:sensor histidine kinase n=1 Tax=Paenibacillus silviterrae TaxID=3242194 RepID=UPI00254278A6|nr:sensor histidine kinase [Paenibacillus chinjuensis]